MDDLYKVRWERLIRWLYKEKESANRRYDTYSQRDGFIYYHTLVEMGRIERDTFKENITTA
jgi:hypothetical protein